MFNAKRLAKYLATGEVPEMTALDEALAENDFVEYEEFAEDTKYHWNGRKCRAKKRCRYLPPEFVSAGDDFFVNSNLLKDVECAVNTDKENGDVLPKRRPIALSSTPSVLKRCGVKDGIVLTTVDIIRKCCGDDHNVSVKDFADLPHLYSHPVAIIKDQDGCLMIITDRKSMTKAKVMKPLMVYLRPIGDRSKHNFIASTYAREPEKEVAYVNNAKAGLTMMCDKNKIARIGLEEATCSHIQTSV